MFAARRKDVDVGVKLRFAACQSIVALLALVLGSCSATSSTPFRDDEPRPYDGPVGVFIDPSVRDDIWFEKGPTEVRQRLGVDVKSTAVIPSHEVIGMVDVNGAQTLGWVGVLEKAQKAARKMGGDAIIVSNSDRFTVAIGSSTSSGYEIQCAVALVKQGQE